MFSGLEMFTRKVVLETLPQDERGFVRIVVASCDKHTFDGQFSRTGPVKGDDAHPRRRRVLRMRP